MIGSGNLWGLHDGPMPSAQRHGAVLRKGTRMGSALEGLEPRIVWEYFERICSIPRCSKNEAAIIDWLESTTAELGLESRRDRAGNLLVQVPATTGLEKAPSVVLQSHVDMVCEKNSETQHDFTRDPIRPRVEDGWVTASGTTLGADNGIGVAVALAVATDRSFSHGPLELLFTVDEETGLTGAASIEPGFFHSKMMLNLDSEEMGVFTIGSAGGRDTTLTLRASREPVEGWSYFLVRVKGLKGGHSGGDIHKNRGNSIKILARTLLACAEGLQGGLRIGKAQGGSKRNAIPREAEAEVAVAPHSVAALQEKLARHLDLVRNQLRGIDDGLAIEAAEAQPSVYASAEDSLRLLRLLVALPHGVLAMSRKMKGLVETSSNIGVLEDGESLWRVICSTRSSLDAALESVLEQIRAAGQLAGAEVEHSDGYPGWEPNPESALLKTALSVYERTFGEKAEVRAIHAGLECGLFRGRYPDLDILSYGPDIREPHSPRERVKIDSVEAFWRFTKALLEEIGES